MTCIFFPKSQNVMPLVRDLSCNVAHMRTGFDCV